MDPQDAIRYAQFHQFLVDNFMLLDELWHMPYNDVL